MREAVTENPVINSAFVERQKHYKFDDDGITSEIVDKRQMDEVLSCVKWHNLGFFIPYAYEGQARSYIPDSVVRLRAPDGSERAGAAASEGTPA